MKRFEIEKENCSFNDILVMRYSPKIRKCVIDKRCKSSFLYIEKGVYRYTLSDAYFEATDGDVVYLPIGSSYTYEVISSDASCMQVEFNLYREGRPLCFSDAPIVIKSREAEELFRDITGIYFRDSFMTLSVLYRMLSVFFGNTDYNENETTAKRKIRPAIDYIDRNLCKPVYISHLAGLCNISTAHLRRLFNEALGESPIKYRNKLLMKYACELLKSGEMNVSETADTLGFADVYTFSQAFKREMSVSPKNFIDFSKK